MYPKVLCLVPAYNAVQPEPFLNFLIFSQYCGKAEVAKKYAIRWFVAGPKWKTVQARNVASELVIKEELDFLLLMDDDMVVPDYLLDHLLRWGVDIVSPLFFRAVLPVDPLIYTIDEFGDRVPMYDYPKSALFETPGGNGTGVMLVKAEVLKAMDEERDLHKIWWTNESGGDEDINFCDRARELGFKTWCDSNIEVKQMSLPQAIGSAHYEEGRLTR